MYYRLIETIVVLTNLFTQDNGILADQRRLTVAVTRAKHKLIIVADRNAISQYAPFVKLFNIVQAKNIIDVNDASYDFTWESIVESFKENMRG